MKSLALELPLITDIFGLKLSFLEGDWYSSMGGKDNKGVFKKPSAIYIRAWDCS